MEEEEEVAPKATTFLTGNTLRIYDEEEEWIEIVLTDDQIRKMDGKEPGVIASGSIFRSSKDIGM